ncbi:MAG: hypothetical protein ACKVTZ_05240 [Bacteroidia bacterium]
MERLELIERYAEGQMQGTELATFTKELENDATLRQELKEYKDLVGGIRLHGQQNFMNMVTSWEKELQEKEKSQANVTTSTEKASPFTTVTKTAVAKKTALHSQWIKYVSAAACVVLIAVFGYNFLGNNEVLSGDALYASEYSPYNAQSTREDDFSKLSEVKQAIALYEMKKYTEAIAQCVKLEKTMPDSLQLNLYHGLASLETNDLATAKTELERVAKSGNENYSDIADWYLALTFMKENKTEEAKTLLTTISNTDGHSYRVKAKNVLKKAGK